MGRVRLFWAFCVSGSDRKTRSVGMGESGAGTASSCSTSAATGPVGVACRGPVGVGISGPSSVITSGSGVRAGTSSAGVTSAGGGVAG